jgi:hypothetical protein
MEVAVFLRMALAVVLYQGQRRKIKAAVVMIVFALIEPAWAGERMMCNLEPAGSEGWHYRTRIPPSEEKCWYLGPRMKPRHELYWAEVPAVPPMTTKQPPPWMLEQRWPHRDGWEHKE